MLLLQRSTFPKKKHSVKPKGKYQTINATVFSVFKGQSKVPE